MRKIEELRNQLRENIYDDVELFFQLYTRKKYDYLGINLDRWEEVFVDILNDLISLGTNESTFSVDLTVRLNSVVKNFLNTQFKVRHVKVFDRLLLKLIYQSTNNTQILIAFYKEMLFLNFEFTREFYDFMMSNSLYFKELVLNTKVDYNWFSNLAVKGDTKTKRFGSYRTLYEFFPLLKGMTQEERKKIVDRIFLGYNKEKRKIVNDYIAGEFNTKDERYKVVSSVIACMKQSYRIELKLLAKNQSDLFDIDNSSNTRKSLYKRFPDSEFITQEEKILIIEFLLYRFGKDFRKQIDDYISRVSFDEKTIQKILSFISDSRDLYESFLDKGHLPFNCLRLEKLYETIAKRKQGKVLISKSDISEVPEERVEEIINEAKILNNTISKNFIYGRFPDSEFVSLEEKIIIVEYLLCRLDKELQKKIKEYCIGKRFDSETNEKIKGYIATARNQYNKYLASGYMKVKNEKIKNLYQEIEKRKKGESVVPTSKIVEINDDIVNELIINMGFSEYVPRNLLTLEDRFPDSPYITQEEKSLIVNYLLNRLDDFKRKLIIDYIDEKLVDKSEKLKARGYIGNIKELYSKFLKKGHLPEPNKIMEELYLEIEQRKNNAEKQVDGDIVMSDALSILVARFSNERQELLNVQFRLLEAKYYRRGFSKEEFDLRIQGLISIVNSYPVSKFEDYMEILIDMASEDLKQTEILV